MLDIDLSKEQIAYASMSMVVVFWGMAWPIGRILSLELPAITAAFFRYSIVFPILFFSAYMLKINIKLKKEVLAKIMLLGFLQVSLYNYLFLTGVKYTSASDAVLIISINPVLTAIISSFVYQDEKLKINKIIGLFLSITGVAIIAYNSPNTNVENRLLGDAIIFGAALTWALYTTFSRPIYKTVHPIAFNAWSSLFGWLLLGILSIPQQPWNSRPSKSAIYSLLYLGIIAAALANVIFSNSVKYIGPSRTAVFVNLVPVFGVLSSVIILKEKVSIVYLLAFLIIITGIYLVQKTKNTKTNTKTKPKPRTP